MKNYFSRLIFGLLSVGIATSIAYIFNIERLQFGNSLNNFILILIMTAGGWGGLHLYKASKN